MAMDTWLKPSRNHSIHQLDQLSGTSGSSQQGGLVLTMVDFYREKTLIALEGYHRTGYKKWGWVVYRTTYGDNEKWARFEERFQEQIRRETVILDRPADEPIHIKYLDFPVRSDEAKYNNATTAQLRTDFKEWLDGDGPLKEQEMTLNEKGKVEGAMPYSYFIRVDTEAMESVLKDDTGRGCVDLVQVDWPEDDEEAEEVACEDGHPPLEGMTTFKVGFVRVPVISLYPDCWGDLETMAWKVFGVARPPRVCSLY
jgi:hypothetical protein